MPKPTTLLLIVCLTGLVGLLGYNYYYQPLKNWGDRAAQVVASPLPSGEPLSSAQQEVAELQALIAQLTPRQKSAQLLASPVTVTAEKEPTSLNWVEQNQVGFVTLFGENISSSSARAITTQLEAISTANTSSLLRPLVAVDHEGGAVQRLSGAGFTQVPAWQELCALSAPQRATVFNRSATELRQAGISLILAPVVDLAPTSAAHPILKNRLCSSDPDVVAQRAQELITVFSQQHVIPVIKHFPGIGQTTRDLHREFDRVTVTATEAAVFRMTLDTAATPAVMISHVGVINQYPDKPCSLSADCVKELSANYPQALVMTDALEMNSAHYQPGDGPVSENYDKTLAQVSLEAIAAGNQVLVYGPSVKPAELELVLDALEQKYQTDPQFATQLDQRLLQVLKFKASRL